MINALTPNGLHVRVPETLAEDPSPHFQLSDKEGYMNYYAEFGYCVIKNAIPGDLCDSIRNLWDKEIKTSSEYIYRQTTCKAERNKFNEQGFVMNPILNLQSVNPKFFNKFRKCAESILSHKGLHDPFYNILGDDPKVVQSMYFEGNSATWEHQDTYYLDSEKLGTMCGGWLAVEDIAPKAGRFFVIPGSHKIDMKKHSVENNVATNHDSYILSVLDEVKGKGTAPHAPALEQGSILLWNSKTVHGSLATQDSKKARSSITVHAIPNCDRFMQQQTRIINTPTTKFNETYIYSPKDQVKFKYRLIKGVEANFPSLFYMLKRWAIVSVMFFSQSNKS